MREDGCMAHSYDDDADYDEEEDEEEDYENDEVDLEGSYLLFCNQFLGCIECMRCSLLLLLLLLFFYTSVGVPEVGDKN